MGGLYFHEETTDPQGKKSSQSYALRKQFNLMYFWKINHIKGYALIFKLNT